MIRTLKHFARSALAGRGWHVGRLPRPLAANPEARLRAEFEFVLSRHILRAPQPYFLQVGAFNGVDGDPLREFVTRGDITGCLVEPQADAFRQLRAELLGRAGVAVPAGGRRTPDGAGGVSPGPPGGAGAGLGATTRVVPP